MANKSKPNVVAFPGDAQRPHEQPGAASAASQSSADDIASIIGQDKLPEGYYEQNQRDFTLVRAIPDGSDHTDDVLVEIAENGHKQLWPLHSEGVADALVIWHDRMTGGDPAQFLPHCDGRCLLEAPGLY